ncbi:60 kDa SS-A/Ro ribonucleoprotein-like isoform X2 [Xenia sp. Carnegie-2017]|uniref:60 kDa SS-A/Ro ribonucleoprotein-like isoform X2 n=1 Tax=Xenia sp. Carnegie-2017 TaxID=2897299 RepID=UPI001F03AB4A|nr:60 kDa SS-A/Ro ribonucleoprotein-like isoform X2 [Xenia sp. Carnegie-2017]
MDQGKCFPKEEGKQRLEVQELLRQPWKCFDKSIMHQEKFKRMEEYGRKHPEKVTLLNELRVIFKEEFLLGKGSDGTRVYVALGNNGYGKAVKRIHKDSSGKDFAKREKEIFNELNAKRSNYVVNFWDLKENLDEEYLYMILDLCEESLESYVKSSSLQDLQKVVPKVLIQVLNGLVHLHSGKRPILHRDLRPSNVLLDVQGNFLIADFGISHMLSDETSTHRSIERGAKYWIAPESYDASDESIDKVRYKKESDVMNAGMVAYYVATKGKHPFGPEAYRLQNMLEGKPVGLKEIRDVQLKDLLSWMLQRQPRDRPSADKALKHPYLQSDEEKINMLCDMGNQLELKHSQDTKLVEQLEEINGNKSEDINYDMDLDEIERANGKKNKENPSHDVFLKDELDMEENEDVAHSQKLDFFDKSSIQSSAGGFGWKVGDMDRFRRFLVLGSDKGTFYICERTLDSENEQVVLNLLKAGRGVEVVNEIEKYSIEGRTVRQQTIVFALAVCARKGDLATKRQAYKALPKVCRIPTHLFMFIEFCKLFSKPGKGWGRAHRNAIKRWYKEKEPKKLAMDITKYQKRKGWSHRDVARLMHFKSEGTDVSDELFVIMKYVVCGWKKLFEYFFPEDRTVLHRSIGVNGSAMLEFFRAVEDIKTAQEEARVIELINQYNLVREHIPTHWLNSKEVWRALAQKMPMTAMLRNLGKMTIVELLDEQLALSLVCEKLLNQEKLKRARIHPFNVLVALNTYLDGHSERGKLTWNPNEAIVNALEEAFYLSFKSIQPTNKRYMLALDVSGSMSYSGCAGTPCLTPRVAAAAMSMVTARTESKHLFVAFSHEIVPLMISSDMTFNEVLELMELIPNGGTDCAQPMLYAIKNNLEVDVFIVYTDSETKAGYIHPSKALKRYREHTGIQAKLIVVAMTSNGFTIADPNDSGMLDIVGFDSAALHVMREFVLG